MSNSTSFRSVILSVPLLLLATAGCRNTGSSLAEQSTHVPIQPVTSGVVEEDQVIDIKLALAQTMESEGDDERAKLAYHEVLKADPRNLTACHRLAILYDRQQRFDKSTEYFQRALKLQPANPEIFCNIGYSFYTQGRWQEAEMNLRQAIAINPDHNRAHNNLAMLMAHTGRIDEAIAAFRLGSNSLSAAESNVAFILSTHGRLQEARAAYERALAADPGFELAQTRLEELESIVAQAESPANEAPTSTPISLAAASTTDEPEEYEASFVEHAAFETSQPQPAVRALERDEPGLVKLPPSVAAIESPAVFPLERFPLERGATSVANRPSHPTDNNPQTAEPTNEVHLAVHTVEQDEPGLVKLPPASAAVPPRADLPLMQFPLERGASFVANDPADPTDDSLQAGRPVSTSDVNLAKDNGDWRPDAAGSRWGVWGRAE